MTADMSDSSTWIMIPARGGSRGVPRKNVRLLGGLPLIVHVIRAALESCDADKIIVITDDDEIDAVASAEGVRIVREGKTTGRATLDDVALKVADEIEKLGAAPDDIFLTIQPTCPFLRPVRIDEARQAFDDGAGCVITVVDDRHLGWRMDAEGNPEPDYEARVNRQMLPPQFRESGAIIGCRLRNLRQHGTRIVAPIRLIEVGKQESLDIDDFSDWAVAEYIASRRRIVIRADASETMGMGHAYRAIAVAQELARHRIVIATDSAMPLGQALFSEYPFEVVTVDGSDGFLAFLETDKPDLVILDQLDTERGYVRAIRQLAGNVVTFEDLGAGALEADVLVSDLYMNLDVADDRQLAGISNAILAPSFETSLKPAPFRENPENVLVVFGGTDPSRLTERALQALAQAKFAGHVTVVLGPGADKSVTLERFGLNGEIRKDVKHMPGLMQQADLAISSGGRTVTELVSLGVPVLCLCQNEKELTHTHASARYGVVNLGLGALVDVDTVANHIERLLGSVELRQTLRSRALHETRGRSNTAIIDRIMRRIGWA